MKKILILAVVCLSVVCSSCFSSCFRESNTYNASITEKHFASHDNQIGAEAVIKTIHTFWDGDYSYKGLSTQQADIKANLRFIQSVTSLRTHTSELEEYFAEGDYFIYTLKRTTGGDNVVLHQYKFSNEGCEEIYDILNSNEE